MTKAQNLLACIFFATTLLAPFFSAVAQTTDLHITAEIKKAYKNKTRKMNGEVAEGYWQNRSDYQIKAELNPATRILTGEEVISYTNNSPDTLSFVVIRLYQDRYKKNNLRDEEIAIEDMHDGVEIKKVVVDGQQYDTQKLRRKGTNLYIPLPKKLAKNNKASIEINWAYQVPKSSDGRTGIFGENNYFVAYWFPQMAVYDDISGWDMLNYTGTTEFYNDFGNFDVTLTVPKNFLLWATGVFQNPEEVLNEKYLQRYKQALTSDKVVNIVTKDDQKKGNITKDKDKLTYKFKADYVPDFAWATSNNYLWDAGSVVVESNGRRVVVGAAYKAQSKDFYEVAEIGLRSVEFLSKEMPAVPFPYPNLTVFNGTGGMEFPMMVNDGSTSPRSDAVFVTSHEIAHTYFPFYMGINERKYAFMDEGFAQFLPMEIQMRLAPEADSKMENIQNYAYSSGREAEMPMMVPSHQQTGFTYGICSYYRPGTAYVLLRELLGDDLFKKALKEYMNRWNGKHPVPYDFFFTFNDVAKQDLTWFWRPWFFEIGVPDLAIKSAEASGKIVIERKGALPIPINLEILMEDGSKEYFYETAAIWKDGKKEFVIDKKFAKKVKSVSLSSLYTPDHDMSNNLVEVE
jgi:hypothetical protein